MIKWLFLFLLFPIVSIAQTYKYIGVEDGLSNRRVYNIPKDHKGYMWFLTHEGIDRYDGSEFKHYKLFDGIDELNSSIGFNWLYIDKEGVLWEISRKGRVFQYDSARDLFTLTYKLPKLDEFNNPSPVSFSFIDNHNNIWLCNRDFLFLYNTRTQKISRLINNIKEEITCIKQIDDTHFFVGTGVGIHYAELVNQKLELQPCEELDKLKIQVNEIYFHSASKKLLIGTFQRGIFIYDIKLKRVIKPEISLEDLSISCIKPLSMKELLIATDGAGVYKINIATHHIDPYIIADYDKNNAMNGNSINDIYVDQAERIWLANYPIGITVRNNRYSSYNWIKHAIGNKQSLINNQVNAIIEDSDGDLWFGTNNGISQYNPKTKTWNSFPAESSSGIKDKNKIFITLCEVSPGIIWAGGYSSGFYQIDKRNRSTKYFTPTDYNPKDTHPDKYIRDITKDSEGNIWSGGYHYLKKRNLKENSFRIYNGVTSITAILEKDNQHMWIGSASGLYLLNKESGVAKYIKLPIESSYIYSLYQAKNGLLYIGTSGYGLLIYNLKTKLFTHYHTENSALISNNIYSILSDHDVDILLGTENGLSSFYPKEKIFHNWTKDQGLMTIHFNSSSGVLRKNGHFVVGSSDGAVEFDKDMKIPRNYSSKMVFSDFKLFYQEVYPNDKNSPLTSSIDDTKILKLKSNQNIFSLKVSSINYDYPSNILYSWKLEGFYDEWSHPGKEDVIRFTNIDPGTYTLRVRAISSEDKRVIIEERSIQIEVAYPFWLSIWAILIYIIIIGLIAVAALRVIILSKQRKASDEKIHFFINTAHDIRTPLTLIKAPLEELEEKESLSQDGVSNINTALRNVNALLRLTTNLINFERVDTYSSELFIGEYEVNMFMSEIYDVFRPYADIKHINFTYESNFRYLNVWFDKNKMDSILKNIVSNALKYTPDNGNVSIFASDNGDTWSIEVKDTGIGIPTNEQKKLFKIHFRGSNAINSMVTGSGIGLMLVWKLVRLHRGKITMNSIEHQGSVAKIVFHKDSKYYHKARLANKKSSSMLPTQSPITSTSATFYKEVKKENTESNQRILIVEDNDELRNYLSHTLSDKYNVKTCSNGKKALVIVKEYKPELIISDIMMPEMRGDELCSILKSDIETSHIPIILLTALNDENNILAGLNTGADEYVVKPFNIGILKATIASLLTNRALLRNRYANPEAVSLGNDCINCSTDLDWKFIATVKKSVEDNLDNSAFTVDVLCNLMSMSRTSFYNKIKALTDQAPGDYIRIIRLTRAAQLLKEGKHNITEVAELTGFNDAKYFREVFKKHFKVSPSKYGKGETAPEATEDKPQPEQET
ncbi:hybrid sensor histidine kinase/response regulator transcription factor [Bacteroides neonati]|uniref:hybrid sensor histidine kinase/response regulator transcription factor n=1 Tax=Bacteroides neonati TaxID=1347393 RepID=UPI0004BC4E84|nr:two-component regulator propeller domain-containing protein [Bacteroides neonati]